jgi:sulfite dehydrogenase (cytochrome) subunit B
MNAPLTCSLVLFAMSCANVAVAGEETIKLHDAPDRDLVVARCSTCHSVDYVQMNAPVFDRAGWQKSVRKMIDAFGAPITDDDAKRIVEYLGNNY